MGNGCSNCTPDATNNPDYNGKEALGVAVFVGIVLFSLFACNIYRFHCKKCHPEEDKDAPSATPLPTNPRRQQQQQQQQASSSRDHVVVNINQISSQNCSERYQGERECSICCSEAKEDVASLPSMWRVLPECQHKFHADCLKEWLATNKSCPLCRKVVACA